MVPVYSSVAEEVAGLSISSRLPENFVNSRYIGLPVLTTYLVRMFNFHGL